MTTDNHEALWLVDRVTIAADAMKWGNAVVWYAFHVEGRFSEAAGNPGEHFSWSVQDFQGNSSPADYDFTNADLSAIPSFRF